MHALNLFEYTLHLSKQGIEVSNVREINNPPRLCLAQAAGVPILNKLCNPPQNSCFVHHSPAKLSLPSCLCLSFSSSPASPPLRLLPTSPQRQTSSLCNASPILTLPFLHSQQNRERLLTSRRLEEELCECVGV